MTETELRSVQQRVHAVLLVALAVSVVANVLAAEPTFVGRAVASWPPVALMLVVDVLGRAPKGSGALGWISSLGAGAVALVAGVASFSHMQHVARAAGESELVAVLFPLTVDGLAVVASVSLVEINRRLAADVVPLVPVEPAPFAVAPEPSTMPEPAVASDSESPRPLVMFTT